MMPIILSPLIHRFLTLLIFLFIPISILAPHAVVWEIIFGGLIGIYYSQKYQLAQIPPSIIAALLAIPLWGLVTTVWSTYPLVSLLMSLKILALVILGVYWCRLTLSLAPSTQASLIRALIGGLFLGLLFLLGEFWLNNPWQRFWEKSSSKAFAQASLMLSLVVWPFSLWAFQRPLSLTFRIGLVTCLHFCVFWSLFHIDCDTAPIGLFLGLCALIGTLFLPRLTSWAMRLFIPLIILSFPLVSLYAFKPESIPHYYSYFYSPSYIDRLYIWNEVATTSLEHPWLGIGIDGTPHHEKTKIIRKWSYINKEGNLKDTQSARFSMHPHNAILQLWLELGVTGIILGLLLVHIILHQIYCSNLRSYEKAVSAGLFTGTLAILWVSLGIWQNWWISGVWVIVGLTIMLFRREKENNEIIFQ